MGLRNVLCTDIGGTSFDIALITDGRFEITQTPDIARFVLNMPLVRIDSIGAGTGSFVRVNPNSNRPELGPDSAGSRIGVCWPRGRPRDGLGHRPEPRARAAQPGLLPRRRSRPRRRARARRRSSGRSPAPWASTSTAAAGRDRAVRADAQERGGRADPRQGLLAGRLHAALLRRRRPAARRRLHRRTSPTRRCSCPRGRRASRRSAAPARTSTTATTRPSTCRCCRRFGEAERAGIGGMITAAWLGLQDRVAAEFAKSGDRAREHPLHARRAHAVLRAAQRHRVRLAARGARAAAQVDDLIATFEDAYAKMYASSARSPEFGYLVTHVIVHGTVDVEKPALPQLPEEPGQAAAEGVRPVHWGRASGARSSRPRSSSSSRSRPGNTIEGPAIVEHSATTFAIPPGRRREARRPPHLPPDRSTEGSSDGDR